MKTRASISGEIIGGVGSIISIALMVLKYGFIIIVSALIGAAIYILIWKIVAEMKMRKIQKQFEKELEAMNGNE